MSVLQNRQTERALDALTIRRQCRIGQLDTGTSGLALGCVQANLVVLPSAIADDFLRFCVRNPKPCPLVGVSEKGIPNIPSLGDDLDLRTDLPRYRIWEKGKLIDEPTDVSAYWTNDLVAFAIGCSFSFEELLIADGIPLRHIETDRNVAMYRTNIQCAPAGPFQGPLVVSMRPFKPLHAIRAIQITSRLPAAHGAPIHLGDPAQIGIPDVANPDYGDATSIMRDEIPVFWACGVTPQAAIAAVKLDFAITHAPGAMLVTDRRNVEFSVL